jgi:tetratricopeptide (TPR) repeat protein
MKRSLLLLSLAIPALATAKSTTWFLDGADGAEISGPVELILYRSEDTDWTPAVFVALPEDEEGEVDHYLAKLSLVGPNQIPESLAGDLGLKVGESSGAKFAVIPQLQLGDASLSGVRFEVGSDLVLNLNTLDELSFAILPSSGVVRIAPSTGADELLGAVGEAIQGSAGSEKPWFFRGDKMGPRPFDLVVEGALLDQEGVLRLALHEWSSALGGEVALPDDAVIREGERYVRAAATLGGLALTEAWLHHEQDKVGPDGNLLAVLGYDVLYGLDLAFDPTTDRIAFAKAAEVKAADPSALLLETARKDFSEAEEKAAGEDEAATEEEDDSEGDAAAVSRHTDLADALWDHGSRSEALEHYAAAAGAAGERCGPILTHGRRLAELGRHEEALEPLRTAGDLWDRWWAQDREVREAVDKDRKVAEGTFTTEQSSSCHEAWGDLAASHFALGQHDEVGQIYAEHLEFDDAVARFQALSRLVQGDAVGANAALRQGLQLGARNDADARLALGFANAGLKRPEAVRAQLDYVRSLADPAPLTTWYVAVWLARSSLGNEAALDTATALVDADPLSIPARLERVIASRELSGGLDEAAEMKAIGALLDEADRQRPGDDAVAAWRLLYRALDGEVEAAKAALVAEEDPREIDHYLARAAVAEMAGDPDVSAQALSSLIARWPQTPIPVNWAEFQ